MPEAPEPPLSIADVAPHCVPFPGTPGGPPPCKLLAPYHPTPAPRPHPQEHMLPVNPHVCKGDGCALFGWFPDPPLKLTGVVDESLLEQEKATTQWDVNTSVFQPRVLFSESKDYTDSPQVLDAMFHKDWAVLENTPAFRAKLSRIGATLAAVRDALQREFRSIAVVHAFYSASSEGHVGSMRVRYVSCAAYRMLQG